MSRIKTKSTMLLGLLTEILLYLITVNDGKVLTWKEFRHAFISCYYNSVSREDILGQKLEAVLFKGTQYMAEYCEAFVHSAHRSTR